MASGMCCTDGEIRHTCVSLVIFLWFEVALLLKLQRSYFTCFDNYLLQLFWLLQNSGRHLSNCTEQLLKVQKKWEYLWVFVYILLPAIQAILIVRACHLPSDRKRQVSRLACRKASGILKVSISTQGLPPLIIKVCWAFEDGSSRQVLAVCCVGRNDCAIKKW